MIDWLERVILLPRLTGSVLHMVWWSLHAHRAWVLIPSTNQSERWPCDSRTILVYMALLMILIATLWGIRIFSDTFNLLWFWKNGKSAKESSIEGQDGIEMEGKV